MLASLICTAASCSMWFNAVVANVQHSKRNFRLEPQALWDLALSSFPRWFGRSSNFHHRTPSLEPLAPFQLLRLNRRHNLPARLGPNAQSILVPSTWNGTASYLAADKPLISNHLTIGTDVL